MSAHQTKKRYTVTSALPYANGPLHIGHIAGAYLPADIFVRFKKMQGNDVAFICGSDEHGAAITLRAKKEGTTPQAIVDKYHAINKKAFADFGIDFDIYHRTSDALHHDTAQEFFKTIYKKGEFTQETSAQFFDEEHQQFLADRYVTGECPKCHHPSAYGDQCEKCGSSLSPTDLINPKSTLSGKTPVLKETTHFYLPMDKHEEWLKEWIEEGKLDGKIQHNPKEWKNQVIGQCKSWIDGGLMPRAITRDLDWGVKVPVEGGEGKVLYVWFDAPIGYVSATKAWAEQNGKNWKDYWQNEDTKLIHFIGKDNIVFHCIIFPIILKLHGDYILPDNVPANEFLNLEGDKLSTSRNWAVWLHEYMEDFPGKEDELRYVLTSIAPENKDSEFTWKDYQARVNNELVAILGNFVNRVIVLMHKYYNGVVPVDTYPIDNNIEHVLNIIFSSDDTGIPQVPKYINNYHFRDALNLTMSLARAGNKYLTDKEPWKMVKNGQEKEAEEVLTYCLHIISKLAIGFYPFLPNTSKKLFKMLNLNDLYEKAENGSLSWSEINKNHLIKGHKINQAELLFAKIEDDVIEAQIKKLETNKKQNELESKTIVPQKEMCTFEDFMKMDIRVGKILEAEKVKKADKLLQLKVDTGVDTRTILSGIAEHYSPEEVIGKEVSVLINLAPRKIRGIESQGMILMAENKEGKLTFVKPEDSFEAGSEVR